MRLSDSDLRILAAVAEITGVGLPALVGAGKHYEAVTARQIAYAMLYIPEERTLSEVAAICGRTDHTTVMHGLDALAAKVEAGCELNGVPIAELWERCKAEAAERKRRAAS
jgi:chromosomal replication initiation ATPase DnaA